MLGFGPISTGPIGSSSGSLSGPPSQSGKAFQPNAFQNDKSGGTLKGFQVESVCIEAFQLNAFQNDHTGSIKAFQVCFKPPSGPPTTGGGAGFVQTFTRRRWREFMDVLAAEAAAVADIQGSRTVKQQEKLQDAIAATNKAILAAHDQAETAKVSEDLARLANSLNAAVGATRVTASIRHANAAIIAANSITEHFRRLQQEQEEEEEMEMILLLLQ